MGNKIEVVALVGRKEKNTFHPKYGGLFRGKMVTVDEAILKDSKIFVTKEQYAKMDQVLQEADKKAAAKPVKKTKEVNDNAR